MALKKVEISDRFLELIGAGTKNPKELGEVLERYASAGVDSYRISPDNLMLINTVLDLAIKLNKEAEVNQSIKEALKDISIKLMNEF